MASQVLSGTGPVSYTNNTGENVRVVINYLGINEANGFANEVVISFGSGSAVTTFNSIPRPSAIGRNLAFVMTGASGQVNTGFSGNNAYITGTNDISDEFALPTEVMLAPSETFSISMQTTGAGYPNAIGGYNIVIIPEGG